MTHYSNLYLNCKTELVARGPSSRYSGLLLFSLTSHPPYPACAKGNVPYKFNSLYFRTSLFIHSYNHVFRLASMGIFPLLKTVCGYFPDNKGKVYLISRQHSVITRLIFLTQLNVRKRNNQNCTSIIFEKASTLLYR